MSCEQSHGATRIRDAVATASGHLPNAGEWHHARRLGGALARGTGTPDKTPADPQQAAAAAVAMYRDLGVDPSTDPSAAAFVDDLAAGRVQVTAGQAEAMRYLGRVTHPLDDAAPGGPPAPVPPAAPPTTQAPAPPKNTGKNGTDVPPLVVNVPAAGRFYVAHPDDKAAAVANIETALANGTAFPSITTCLGTLDKPALVPWATGMTADAAEARIRDLAAMDEHTRAAALADMLIVDPKTGRTQIRKDLTAAHKATTENAAVRGTEVHALVEAISRGEQPDVPAHAAGYVAAYQAFRDEYPDMQVIYTEATVVNRGDGVMGTTDAIVKWNDKYWVLDFKTNATATVYPETGMQLAAAANAEHVVYADGATEPMPPIHGGIGVGLAPDGTHRVFRFDTSRDGANHHGFRAAVAAWRWKRTVPRGRPRPTSRDDLAAL